ncbi:protein TEX261-like isoform X2 [Lineus longissimus]|uniref:protein TEX261-like isoform X2 n=1 Tax=Lineus longissimus TaxID=88925 RepID=UPI00315C7D87
MWFIYLLSWLALIIQITFITLSIAAGLYYLAELVEEYTHATAKVIKYMIISVTAVYVGLFLFEELPLSLIGTGFLAHGVYYLLLQTFPYILLTSPSFIVSVVLLVVQHYLAFSYFSTVWYPFSEVLAFFTLCLWLVPFMFFVSLSANELVLPTLAEQAPQQPEKEDIVTNYFMKKSKKYGLLSFFKFAQDSLLPQRVKKQY